MPTDEEKRTAVVAYEAKQVAELWGDDYPIIKKMFPNAEMMDLAILFKTARALNLNPILKEVYALPTGGGTQIYVGKAGISRKLNEQGGFSVDYARDFDSTAKDGLNPRWGKLSGKGYYVDCTLEHRGKRIKARAYYDEYAPEGQPKPGSSWLKYPISMLEKVAFCKAGRHALGINIPAPEEMGIEVMGEDEGGEAITHAGSVRIIEHPSSGMETKTDARSRVELTEIEEHSEGILNYRNVPGAGREVQIAGQWYPADKQISRENAEGAYKLFPDKKTGKPNHHEADNHVRKHFKGNTTIKTITYEELAALYRWKKEGIADSRWYQDKISEAKKVEEKPATDTDIIGRAVKCGISGKPDSLTAKWAKQFNWPQPWTHDKRVIEILSDIATLVEQGTFSPEKPEDCEQLTLLVEQAWDK